MKIKNNLLLGKNIKIPGALVSKAAGDTLLTYLQSPDKKLSTISAIFDFNLVRVYRERRISCNRQSLRTQSIMFGFQVLRINLLIL